jgi:ABC-type sugar transport system permease subunit
VKQSKNTASSFDKSLRKWPYIFLAPFILSYISFFVFPTLYSLYMSFFRWNVGEKPKFIGIDNYIKLFTSDSYFWKSVSNTFILMLFVIPLCIIVGLFLAELLFNESLKFRGFFQIANYLPYVTTPVAVAIIFSLLFDQKIGVINLFLVKIGIFEQGINWLTAPSYLQRIMLILMILWQWAGYYMLIYLAGMSSISADVYEAARVDGASRIKIFFKITVPLLNNVTFFLVITSVIYTLQIMDQPYLLLRGLGQGSQQSLEKPLMTVMVYFYENCLRQGRLGYGAALTYSLFMIILVFTFFTLFIIRKRGGNNEEN